MTDKPTNDSDEEEGLESEARVAAIRHTLARRLRTHRMHQGKTGAALAQEAGISKAMLSKIESAERIPSVPVLMLLAEALGVELGDLFGGHAASMEPVLVPRAVARAQALADFADKLEIVELGVIDLPGIQIRLSRMSVDGRSKLPRPVQFDGFWIDHVQKGEIVMQIGEREYHLRAGDTLTYRGEVPHVIKSIPAGPTVVLAVQGWFTSGGMNVSERATGSRRSGLP